MILMRAVGGGDTSLPFLSVLMHARMCGFANLGAGLSQGGVVSAPAKVDTKKARACVRRKPVLTSC